MTTLAAPTRSTGTPVAGRHAAPVAFDAPTIPADTLAFTIGDHGDPDQIRAFWVRDSHSSYLEIENSHLPAGSALMIPMDKIPALAALLREATNLAVTL